MDYENKNKDAISTIKQALRQLATNGVPVGNMIKAINDIEEKYAESEDERIRGAIIDHLKDNNLTEWAAWLENQGEQKPVFEMKTPEESLGIDSETYNKIVDECIYDEPKFKYGDRVRNKKSGLEQTLGSCIEDVYEGAFPFRIKDQDYWELVEQKPAEVGPRQEQLTKFEKAVKQVLEEAIECGDTHNLKADADTLLRLVQKSSWSEEDEEQLDRALYMMEQLDMTKSWDDVYNWLKSLKERYTWKPSDEQMLAINTAINVLGKGTLNGKYLIELQELLKKLREK